MKKLFILLALIAISLTTTLSAKNKTHKNDKHYVLEHEIFTFSHGMYLAFPGKLYSVSALYFDEKKGFYTYKSKMRKIRISEMRQSPWNLRTYGDTQDD